MIRKVLIANRGEIACRIIRTCRQMGIATVAVYSDADKQALHVELADEAAHIGGNSAEESYLNQQAILDAMQLTGADAVHPGYGFLAENAQFAYTINAKGLTFIGPPPESIEAMGNKRVAKNLLEGIPYVPGYNGEDQSDTTLIAEAQTIGYPVMVKAAAGGGGKGMRRVDNAEALPEALASARREAKQAFGNDALLLEKALIHPRHIEVQIIGDQHGHVISLGERECSLQRRHQKVVEEAPASNLTNAVREQIQRTAVRVAQQIGYRNAGTVEFLLDAEHNFYFMEMNTRLQVEHPVTEAVFAVDLVRWQIEIAQGTALRDLLPPYVDPDHFAYQPDGHAIEARVYAEAPYNDFLPVTGEILLWDAPHGVRVDAGIRSADVISTHYDPMIAKIIAHGRDRQSAIRKLDYALSQLVLLGLHNNIAFLRGLLTHDAHIAGNISTTFIEEHPELLTENSTLPDAILIATAIANSPKMQTWRNNRNRPIRHTFKHDASAYDVLLTEDGTNCYSATIGEMHYPVEVIERSDKQLVLIISGHRQRFTFAQKGADWWLHARGRTHHLTWQSPFPDVQARAETGGSLRAPMPGQVIAVHVVIEQVVTEGDLLMILEAMKMEHRIIAPTSGVVTQIRYNVGESVQADEILLVIQTDEDG